VEQSLEQDLCERIKASSKNLVAFRHIMLINSDDNVAPADFHYDWSDILLEKMDNFGVEGFRESAKGQIVLRAFPLYALRFPSKKRDYIVIIKQNKDLASAKLLEIENEYLTNPALNSNLVEVRQKSASVFSVDVRDKHDKVFNVRFEVYGKGSSIRGLANVDRRPKIVLIDDPQDTEDSKSDTVLDNDWKWFLSDVKFLGQYSRIFLIGNNLGEKCIVERVIANAETLNFRTRKVAILNANGESSWPEKYDIKMIEKEKKAFRDLGQIDVWMRERMCEATSPETRIFDLLDIIRYAPVYMETIISDCNIFVTVDPASSPDKTACYRAMVVNCVTKDNRWIIVDVPFGRWKADEFIDKMFEVVTQWTPFLGGRRRIPMCIEKGHFKQILEPFIYKEMQRRNIFFDIKEVEHAKVGNKLERVKMLSPIFKAHTIYFPDEAPWLAEMETELNGVTQDGFKSLFVDLIDALSMQIQVANPPVKARADVLSPLEEVKQSNPLNFK